MGMEGPPWADLGDEALLERRITHLRLKIEGSLVEPWVRQLHEELAAKGLVFLPPCHVGDEWFVPVGIPAIFIPFFLVHERLRKLERRMILEAEGETHDWFMKLIRHEAGHACMFAYQLNRKKKWQQTFGLSSREETPSFYRPRPYSRSFVVHLDDWYAQSHPDEDFAETFAVWLTPGEDWRERYRDWKALAKLEYVDELMRGLAGKPPIPTPAYRVSDLDCLNLKLKTYYTRKRKMFEDSYPDFYDNDLRLLFPTPSEGTRASRGSAFLRSHRRSLLDSVCQWTNQKKYPVSRLLARLIERCDQLGLQARPDDPRLPAELSAYITTLVMNHLFTGKFKRTK